MPLIHQVRRAMRLGLLTEGDQLPTAKEVVGKIAINPNTVLKAYREVEYGGLVKLRTGVCAFTARTLSDDTLAAPTPLRAELERWLARAREAGLNDESIEALFVSAFRDQAEARS